MTIRFALLLAVAAPAAAQTMDHGEHHGHQPTHTPPPAASDPQPDHAGHGKQATPGPDEPAMDAPPPSPPSSWAGDALYPPGALAAARSRMIAEHGGMAMGQVMFNIAEAGIGKGADGYRWDGEGWWGGDIHRMVIKSEGEGAFGETLEGGEVQLLYAHAIDAYWNLQGGIRQDFGAGPSRSHATIGIEGLAPYWFEVEAALFLSDKGDLRGRLEAWYDQRITQRLILQPRAELEFAAQDSPREGIGAGLSRTDLGLRLRYEVKREIAPYLGISWERRFGDTARFARAAGEDVENTRLVLGIRFWL